MMCRELGFGEQTYCRWRRTYGGLDVSHARRLKRVRQVRPVRKFYFLTSDQAPTRSPESPRDSVTLPTSG